LTITMLYSLLKRYCNYDQIFDHEKFTKKNQSLADIVSIGILKGKLTKDNRVKFENFIKNNKNVNQDNLNILQNDIDLLLHKHDYLKVSFDNPSFESFKSIFSSCKIEDLFILDKNCILVETPILQIKLKDMLSSDLSDVFDFKKQLFDKIIFKLNRIFENFKIRTECKENILLTFRHICCSRWERLNEKSFEDFLILGVSLIIIITCIRQYNFIDLEELNSVNILKCSKNNECVLNNEIYKYVKLLFRHYIDYLYVKTPYEDFLNTYGYMNVVISLLIRIKILNIEINNIEIEKIHEQWMILSNNDSDLSKLFSSNDLIILEKIESHYKYIKSIRSNMTITLTRVVKYLLNYKNNNRDKLNVELVTFNLHDVVLGFHIDWWKNIKKMNIEKIRCIVKQILSYHKNDKTIQEEYNLYISLKKHDLIKSVKKYFNL